MQVRLLIVFALLLLIPHPVVALPEMDGKVQPGEWDGAEFYRIELNTGIVVNMSILYTLETAYYLAMIDHSSDVNEINLDPSKPHDYFGIEFDNNGDNAIMGTSRSPDDTILVNYYKNDAQDMFMHSFKAYFDENHQGRDDTSGRAGSDGKNLIFEIAKPLKTNDNFGHDFNLEIGSSYQIMIAFWDDQPPHSANAGFNKRVDNNQFLTLIVDSHIDTLRYEIFAILAVIMGLVTGTVFILKGSKTVSTFLSQIYSKTTDK